MGCNACDGCKGWECVSITYSGPNKVAHFIAFFLLLAHQPLVIPWQQVAMIPLVLYTVLLTSNIRPSVAQATTQTQKKSLPIEIVTNQRDALYAPPK